MGSEHAIEMFVGGLVLDPNTHTPVVILKDESGDACLPIWIGAAEATSIASAIKQVALPRPLTHDLMSDMLNELGVVVKRILITELREATYLAELVVAQGDKVMVFDARPSDAIGIALRVDAPIFVAQQVLDQAKISVTIQGAPDVSEEASRGPSGLAEARPTDDGGGLPAGAQGDEAFSSINKEKWTEILNGLDSDDFKYKM